MHAIQYPPEILTRICSHIYAASLPPANPSLDPLIITEHGIPTSFPSSLPPANWSEPLTRRTLKNLCLVNHDWNEAAKPWLWRNLEVRLPRGWLSLVEELAWEYDEETVDQVMEKTVKAAAETAAKSTARGDRNNEETAKSLRESILESLNMPDESISPDLLSPMASREPSPRRFRHKSKSPARWELVRSISDAIQNVMERRDPAVYGEPFICLRVMTLSYRLTCSVSSTYSPRSAARSFRAPPRFQSFSDHWYASFCGGRCQQSVCHRRSRRSCIEGQRLK